MKFQIVFVASNFVSERGDMAILDDIEVIYESDGDDCVIEQEERKAQIDEKAAIASAKELAGANSVSFLVRMLRLFSMKF